MQSSASVLTGSSPSTDVLPPKIAKPIVRQWPPTGTLQWDLRYSPHASSAASPPQASWVIQSPTKTLLTLASVSSIAQDSLPRNTKRGSYEATILTTRLTLLCLNHSGRMQSRLRRLPPSRQVSTATAWRRPTTTHRHPSRMRFPTLARCTPPPKNHSEATRPTSWQSKGNSKCSAKPSEMTSLLPASSTTNNTHVADAALDSNTDATMVEAAATVAVDTMAVVERKGRQWLQWWWRHKRQRIRRWQLEPKRPTSHVNQAFQQLELLQHAWW